MATKRGEDLECDAIAKVRAEIGRPLNAAIRAFNLISEVVELGPPGGKLSNATRVRLQLLQRIITDLRCCNILAERGYGIQAAAIAASVFEGWVTLSAIRDEKAAIKWASHEQEECKTFIYGLVVLVLGIGERVFHSVREAGSFRDGISRVVASANLDRFLGLVLLISLTVGTFLVMQEISRAMGKGALFRLFFEPPLDRPRPLSLAE